MKQKVKKLWNGYALEYSMAFILILISFLCFYYSDMSCIMDNSILTIKALGTGNIFHLYEYTIVNSHSIWALNYEVLLSLLIGIWNIPVIIAEQCFGLDYMNSTAAHLWSKGVLLVTLAMIVFIMLQIAKEYEVGKLQRRQMVLVFATSFFVLFPTMNAVQIDTFSVIFILLGLYAYLKKNTKWFIFFFALALPMKLFAIFLFIPLLLLQEKRIFPLLGKLLAGSSILILTKLIYMGSDAYQYMTKSLSLSTIQNMIEENIQLRYGINVFLLIYIGICVYCYVTTCSEDAAGKYRLLYICMLVYGTFVITVRIHAYWTILMAPFMILIITLNQKYWKVNVLIESICGFVMILLLMLDGNIYGESNFWISKMVLGFLKPTDIAYCNYASPGQFLNSLGLENYRTLLTSVFTGGLIAFAILNAPKWYQKETDEQVKTFKGYIWFRLVLLMVSIGIPIYTYCNTMDQLLVTNMSQEIHLDGNNWVDYSNFLTEMCGYDARNLIVTNEGREGKENLISPYLPDHSMDQPVSFEEPCELTLLRFQADISKNAEMNTSAITVQIIDQESGAVLEEHTLGASLIQDNTISEISLNHLSVEANHPYVVRFIGNPGHDFAKHSFEMYLRINSEDNEQLAHAVWNGVEQEYSIYMELRGNEQ